MKNHHLASQLRVDLQPLKFEKALSPRVEVARKLQASSPLLKHSTTPTPKKSLKEFKKVPQHIQPSRVQPSRSQKLLFEASNKAMLKLNKPTGKPAEKNVLFHRSHQTPLHTEQNVKQDIVNPVKRTTDKAFDTLKRQMCNVIKAKTPECMEVTNTTSLKSSWDFNDPNSLSRESFTFLDVVGRGGYGKVWKVAFRKSKKLYAMKEMSKAVVVMRKSVKSVLAERKVLSKLRSPFIANMVAAFHDRQNLYLVIDLLSGGDLRSHICERRKFSEEETRFFVACIILGLEELSSKRVIHRDLKPENLVLDSKGYIRITDFGIACLADQPGVKDTSGTPGYMAPEVMCCQDHSFGVDHFALGIICFELMMARRPYNGKNRADVREAVLSKQVQISKAQIPPGWSVESADFVNRLIQRHPKNRLGCTQGVSELKNHAWLQKYPWRKLASKQLKSPYLPPKVFPDPEEEQVDSNLVMQYKLLERQEHYSNLFEGYEHKWSEETF